jgi:hypothetical protein
MYFIPILKEKMRTWAKKDQDVRDAELKRDQEAHERLINRTEHIKRGA